MLILNQDQRTLLAEKLCDAGNLAAGALLFGQFLADRFSIWLACAGLILWGGLIGSGLVLAQEGPMTGVFILMGGMLAFAVIITTLDALGQRQNRKKAALLRQKSQ